MALPSVVDFGGLHYLLGNKGAHLFYGNMAYICEICGKSFKVRANLQKHSCNICHKCGKQFAKKQYLQTHSCMDKQVCKLCKRTYSSAARLNNHKCSYCCLCKTVFSTFQKKDIHSCKSVRSSSDTVQKNETCPNKSSTCKKSSLVPQGFCAPSDVKKIIGDGNCFFRAVSFCLTGSEEGHFRLRQQIVGHMERHAGLFRKVTDAGETVTEHIKATRMCNNRTWATQTEIFAAAHMLRRNIWVYSWTGIRQEWIKYSGQFVEPNLQIVLDNIHLRHTGGNHYDAVLSTSKAVGSYPIQTTQGFHTPSRPTPSQPTPRQPTPSRLTSRQNTPSRPTPSQPTPSQPTPSQPTPSRPTPSRPTPSQPTSRQPTHSRPTSRQPSPSQPTPSQSTPSRPTPSQPTPSRPTFRQPTPSRPTSSQPTSSQPTPSRPTPSRPTSRQPSPSQPTPSQSTPSRPTPSQPTPSRPTFRQPTPSRPTSSQPTSSQPTPSRPTPSRPTSRQPSPSQPTPSQPTPSRPTSRQPSPSQPTPSQPTPGRPTPSQPTPSRPTSLPTPSQPTPSQPTPSRPAPSQPTPSRPTPSQPTPSQPTPSRPTPSQPTPRQPTPSQPTPSRPSSRQPTPSQPSPNQPNRKRPTLSRPDPRRPTPSRHDPRQLNPSQPELRQPDARWPAPGLPDPRWTAPKLPAPSQPAQGRPEERILKEIQFQVAMSKRKNWDAFSNKDYKQSEVRREKDRIRKQELRKVQSFKEQEKRRKSQSANRAQELRHKREVRQDAKVQAAEAKQKRKKRMSEDFRQQELDQKKKKRMDPEFREQELDKKKKKRMDPEFREQELDQKKKKRMDPEFREQELDQKKKKRMDPEFREQELDQKKKKRMDPEFREQELNQKKKKRMVPEFREQELDQKKNRRKDPEFREQEQMKMKQNRMDPEFREQELAQKKQKRKNPAFREQELTQKKQKRKNPAFREQELVQKKKRRRDANYKLGENLRNSNKKKIKRKSQEFRDNEKLRKQRRTFDIEEMVQDFHKSVQQGPLYICTCCDQLWYRQSVCIAKSSITSDKDLAEKCITGVKSVDDKEWLCNTCCSTLRQNRMPSLAKANNVGFPDLPEELRGLSNMEERLVAARLPFMQLHELPRGGQLSIHGNMVNVPSNVNKTVNTLPRTLHDSGTIHIKLKRKVEYKHHWKFESVRPNKVMNCVRWLSDNSRLYREEGITLTENWESDFQENANSGSVNQSVEDKDTEDIKCDEHKHEIEEEAKSYTPDKPSGNADDDSWDERTIDDLPPGNMDTLLQPQDLLEESGRVLSLAPGEGNSPLSIFIDKNSETLSFPKLYGGLEREENREVKVHYSDMSKWELRSRDRRVAQHIPCMFFKLKKLQMQHVRQKAQIALRKTTEKSYTAGDLKNPESVKTILNFDDGYRILRDLRGSPPYWEKTKKNLFAMIRQLGIPTWFASFSSAETRWVHLLQILGQTVDKKSYTEEEVDAFTWFKKAELIQKDPVTCARHFDNQVQKLINRVLKNPLNPIAKFKDFFYKVEFQMRGSPHIHMLVWIENAPKIDHDKSEDVIQFIDHHVSCQKPEDLELALLVNRQEHAHSRSCRKKGQNICRFNFPQPPLEATQILDPFPEDMPKEEKQNHKEKWKTVAKVLEDMKLGKEMPFGDFLQLIDMDQSSYIMAIRSSIQRQTVFLKRSVNEIRVNNYNPIVLKCWRANMDLQYVLDAYSCAMYIVSYIAKSQRGISNLLYDACNQARKGGLDIRGQVKEIGNCFLNNVEVAIQEAIYYILQIPLHMASRGVIFINTSPLDKRVILIKSLSALEDLPDDSTDIEIHGLLKHYASRPDELEELCLADYTSLFVRVKSDGGKIDAYKMPGGYILKRRLVAAVIRYVRYSFENDREDYFREILMLFFHWRKEDEIIGHFDSYEKRYQEVISVDTSVQEKMDQYNHSHEALDKAMEELRQLRDADLEDKWDEVAPVTRAEEKEDEAEGSRPSDVFPEFFPGSEVRKNVDVFDENSGESDAQEHLVNYMKDDEYSSKVISLNEKQKKVFHHILHCVKTTDDPFYIFVTGGAGVGKSLLITCIYQALVRYLNLGPQNNPDDPKVLIGAPTGKAAFLVKGNTLHSLFHIPANQGYSEYKPLKQSTLNTLHCKFRNVSLIIIDEISMVGCNMLNCINRRLQQIFGTDEPFGRISILAVGDLFQLKPVFDGWIFENLRNSYGPLATNLWKEHFFAFHLDQIMRQKEDLEFANLLNRLRTGSQTAEDVQLLLSKTLPTSDITNKDYPLDHPHIFLTNARVSSHNNLVSTLAPESKQIKLHALDVVVGDVTREVKRNILQRIPDDTSKTMGLMKTLQSAIGQIVELSTNIDVADGLANGASGKLMCVTEGRGKQPAFIWVLFDRIDIGQSLRCASKTLYTKNIPSNWTPVAQVKKKFPVGKYKNAQVVRQQFPLRPASAKTCHRCQGSTMDSVVIDFSTDNDYRPPHAHYVALSRVRNLDGLMIKNLNAKGICVVKKVVEEMKRLSEERCLQIHVNCLPTLSDSECRLVFHNVRSLRKHFADLSSYSLYLSGHVNIYVETKLSRKDKSDCYQIPGYEFKRFDWPSKNLSPAFGIAVHSRLKLSEDNIEYHTMKTAKDTAIEFLVLCIKTHKYGRLAIVGFYASPKSTARELSSSISEMVRCVNSKEPCYTLIFGDFNVDLLQSRNPQSMAQLKGYRQCITGQTTDYKSCLDHLYTDIPDDRLRTGVGESYFSDHKPIWAALQ